MKHRAGFTLVELLVSSGILIVLATLALANFRTPYRFRELGQVATDLVTTMRGLQIRAAAGEKQQFCQQEPRLCDTDVDCPASACITDTPPGGFGILLRVCSSSGCAVAPQTYADLGELGFALPFEYLNAFPMGGMVISKLAYGQRDPNNASCLDPTPATSFENIGSGFLVTFSATSTRVHANGAFAPDDLCTVRVTLKSPKTGQETTVSLSTLTGLVTIIP